MHAHINSTHTNDLNTSLNKAINKIVGLVQQEK